MQKWKREKAEKLEDMGKTGSGQKDETKSEWVLLWKENQHIAKHEWKKGNIRKKIWLTKTYCMIFA